MNPSEWNESQTRAVSQVKSLYPYLSFAERLEWVDHFETWYPTRMDCMEDLASALKQVDPNRFDVV